MGDWNSLRQKIGKDAVNAGHNRWTIRIRWIGYAAGALAAAFVLNFIAFCLLLYGLDYNASPFRHAVAGVGSVILYPGIVLSLDKLDPFVMGSFTWGVVIFAILAWRERKVSRRLAQPSAPSL
jgi:uncharacterized membrane protein